LISFSGTTSQGPFWRQIREGRKTQTCRLPRKNPVKEGDTLHLYWKVRVSRDRKECHFIALAECTYVQRISYVSICTHDDFARRDGFRDSREMWEWFGRPSLDEMRALKLDVIHWRLKLDKILDSIEKRFVAVIINRRTGEEENRSDALSWRNDALNWARSQVCGEEYLLRYRIEVVE
jgi:hypothetical protein